MTDTTAPRSFVDTMTARLISLAIAVLIGVIIFVYWADDIRNIGTDDTQQLPVVSREGPVRSESPALQQCLDQRVGDVERMKSEGIVNDAQYAEFRERAQELCRAQHSQ